MTENAELGKRLEPQALAALSLYDLPEPESLTLLSFSENAVFKADLPGYEPVVVRLHSLGYHDRDEIESELMWIEALRKDGAVVTARTLTAKDRSRVVTARYGSLPERHAVVFEHLEGVEPESDSLVRDFRLLGRTTAHMHTHAVSWPVPKEFKRFSWDEDGTVGPAGHWGDWRQGPNLDSDARELLERTLTVVLDRLRAYGRDSTRFGLVHADLRLANLLVDEGTVKVIDFDDCGSSWLLYDLASALTFIEDDPQVPELISSWLDGYREIRPLTAEDEAEIPTFLMLRRLVIFAWLGSRPGTELVVELGPAYARVTAELAEAYLARMTRPAPRL